MNKRTSGYDPDWGYSNRDFTKKADLLVGFFIQYLNQQLFGGISKSLSGN